MTPEGLLKSAVVEYLKATGVMYFRMQSGKVRVKGGVMHLSPEGTADILVFKGNRIIWIELKAVGQKTAKARALKQAEFRERVLSEGHHHAVCYSVEDVMEAIG